MTSGKSLLRALELSCCYPMEKLVKPLFVSLHFLTLPVAGAETVPTLSIMLKESWFPAPRQRHPSLPPIQVQLLQNTSLPVKTCYPIQGSASLFLLSEKNKDPHAEVLSAC